MRCRPIERTIPLRVESLGFFSDRRHRANGELARAVSGSFQPQAHNAQR